MREARDITAYSGQRPACVNSIAIGKDGAVYALSNIHGRTELIRIPPVQTGGFLI